MKWNDVTKRPEAGGVYLVEAINGQMQLAFFIDEPEFPIIYCWKCLTVWDEDYTFYIRQWAELKDEKI